jgi:2-dehydro-3-deoxygluconokinase
MLRLAAPAGERLGSARQLDSYVAGAEANVAAALARLGVPTAWVSAVPDSPLGDRVVGELAAAGVDLSFVERIPDSRLGLFFVELGAEPRATRVWYDRRDSAFARLGRLDQAALDGAEFAVVSGITPALGEESRTLTHRFVDEALARDVRVVVDVNYRERLWTADEARETLAPLLARADVVVCAERDAATVFGAGGGPTAFADRWARAASLVVVTRGERGSELVAGGRSITRAARATRIVDRFGAGDAFTAGLVWGLVEGLDDERALLAASTLAALKCTVLGDIAQFSAAELTSAMDTDDERAIIR